MKPTQETITLEEASRRAAEIRRLYHQLEEGNHGSRWSKPEDMVGLMYDIGELGRLVMAAEGRWVHDGDTKQELPEKLAECLWWVFALADRMDIDISKAYLAKVQELESNLSASAAKNSAA